MDKRGSHCTESLEGYDCSFFGDAFRKGLSAGLKNKGKRLIIVHIGSEKGFVPDGWYAFESTKSGDYHDDMNAVVIED